MMKFKSLFRRGQQNHPPPQQQQQQQNLQSTTHQLQQVPLRQANSSSYVAGIEGKAEGNLLLQQQQQQEQQREVDNWGSGGREGGRGREAKGVAKATGKAASRMQELERELELSKKERARLEARLRECIVDSKRFQELSSELAALKVGSFKLCIVYF